jgi:hypothetical protein
MSETPRTQITPDTERVGETGRPKLPVEQLLDLDEKSFAWRERLMDLSRKYAYAALSSVSADVKEELERILNPHSGDLVYEVSTSRDLNDPDHHRDSGILIDTKVEAGMRTTYIQYGPAQEDVCRWTNAEFHSVLGYSGYGVPQGSTIIAPEQPTQ